jgi:hypothetical protein
MPARHTSLRRLLPSGSGFEERLLSTKEGVGETSGQTAGSSFQGSLLPIESRSGRRNRFSSFGADPLRGSQFHRSDGLVARRPLRSGPDVFADALVPSRCALSPAGRSLQILICRSLGQPLCRRRADGCLVGLGGLAGCGNGYRLAKCQGKPISQDLRKAA